MKAQKLTIGKGGPHCKVAPKAHKIARFCGANVFYSPISHPFLGLVEELKPSKPSLGWILDEVSMLASQSHFPDFGKFLT